MLARPACHGYVVYTKSAILTPRRIRGDVYDSWEEGGEGLYASRSALT